MKKEVIAAMTVLAACESDQCASSITVAYVLYDDNTVTKIGPENEVYINASRHIVWPFSEEEARVLLEAKMKGLL